MRKTLQRRIDHDGFTLLEITITIILAAILGTILFQFMGSVLTNSGESVIKVQDGFELSAVMERITADYRELISQDTDPLGTLKTRIDAGLYGTYAGTTSWVTFNGTNEDDDTSGDHHVLKVTVSIGGQSLTSLFTDTGS
jgi:prepilin-type N-terminal cleavage/methylation domain-containing protein